MGVKHSAKKKAAVAIAALIVAFLFLTTPSYHSEKVLMAGNVTLNSTGYYEQYYGSNVTVEFNEQYLEFRNPLNAFNYYCEPSFPSLQVGVFLDQPGLACYGIKTPLPETGYESYEQAYYACYGFRVAERVSCLYG